MNAWSIIELFSDPSEIQNTIFHLIHRRLVQHFTMHYSLCTGPGLVMHLHQYLVVTDHSSSGLFTVQRDPYIFLAQNYI